MHEFFFDSLLHRYTLDGRVLPSVTQILQKVGIIDPSKYGEGAADFGSRVHLATELWDLMGEDTSDLEVLPRLECWKGVLKNHPMTFTAIEKRTYCPKYLYAGTIDRETEDAVIDLKSGREEPWHRVQLSAYCMMCGRSAARRICVYLGNETYKIKEYPIADVRKDFNVFLSALTLVRFQEEK